MNPIRPLIVIGAGPAGMMAALTAAERGIKVLLLERRNRIGGKLPVTGDGKGNLTNINLHWTNYHSCEPEFVLPALSEFDFIRTRDFFEKLGLKIYIDKKGKAFPYSREAISIQRLLEEHLKRLEVEIITGVDIKEIRKIGPSFEIILKQAPSLYAQRIIVATGGLAAPQLGATGDGYHWAVKLGHHLEPQFPALVQLTINIPNLRLLNKLKLTEVLANLYIDNELITGVRGDLLFLANGISGTSVFALSRMASEALSRGKKVAVRINFTPDLNIEELNKFFFSKKKSEPFILLSLLLQGILPERLSQHLLKEYNISFYSAIGQLADSEIVTIITHISDFYLPIKGTQSWKYAQITCGGISAKEVEPKTMESKIVPNLYFAGEILDVDGDCGGYNLQWAWSSGYLAGKSV